MARSPTARIELSKKSFTEQVTALLALLALLEAAGEKAGFAMPKADEADEDENESEDEESEDESDDEDEDEEEAPRKKKRVVKEDDEDEDDEDEAADDEDADDSDDEEEDEDEEEPLSSAQLKKVKAALQSVLDAIDRKAAVGLLTKFKVEKVSDLKEAQVSLFVKAADKLIASAPKAKAKSKSKGK